MPIFRWEKFSRPLEEPIDGLVEESGVFEVAQMSRLGDDSDFAAWNCRGHLFAVFHWNDCVARSGNHEGADYADGGIVALCRT